MKKWLSMLLTLLLALPALSFAQVAPESGDETKLLLLQGVVTELLDDEGFLMEDAEQGVVQVNTNQEETYFAGVNSDGDVTVGQYIFVEYDGKMTFSLPPQVFGLRVYSYTVSGNISEVADTSVMISGDPIFGDVLANLDEAVSYPTTKVGMPVTLYYDGVMTASYPGMISARRIVVPTLSGYVTELTEDGLMLVTEEDQIYQVQIAKGEALPEGVGMDSHVEIVYDGAATKSAPPIVNALSIRSLDDLAEGE